MFIFSDEKKKLFPKEFTNRNLRIVSMHVKYIAGIWRTIINKSENSLRKVFAITEFFLDYVLQTKHKTKRKERKSETKTKLKK